MIQNIKFLWNYHPLKFTIRIRRKENTMKYTTGINQ